MTHTVAILGAGTAAAGGCPVMNNFLKIAKILRETGKLSGFEKDFDIVDDLRQALQFQQIKYRLDATNLETLFCAIEMGEILTGVAHALDRDLPGIKESFLRLVAVVLERTQRCQFIVNGRDRIVQGFAGPRGYHNLAMLINEIRNHPSESTIDILTFNYDIGLETSLRLLDIPYISSPKGIDYSNGTITHIYKLHGSIDWLHSPESDAATQYEEFKTYQARISSAIQGHARHWEGRSLAQGFNSTPLPLVAPLITEGAQPTLVPPSEAKFKHRTDSKSIWQYASRSLENADTIIVSGYSMPDSDLFFRHFWAISQLNTRELRSMYIIDRDAKIVPAKYANLVGEAVRDRVSHVHEDVAAGFDALRVKFKNTQATWIDA